MAKEIEAIYENGAFYPVEPVELAEHQRVRIIVGDTAPSKSNGHPPEQASLPKTGAELVAYWEELGLIGSRPEITNSVEYAEQLRRRAETRNR